MVFSNLSCKLLPPSGLDVDEAAIIPRPTSTILLRLSRLLKAKVIILGFTLYYEISMLYYVYLETVF